MTAKGFHPVELSDISYLDFDSKTERGGSLRSCSDDGKNLLLSKIAVEDGSEKSFIYDTDDRFSPPLLPSVTVSTATPPQRKISCKAKMKNFTRMKSKSFDYDTFLERSQLNGDSATDLSQDITIAEDSPLELNVPRPLQKRAARRTYSHNWNLHSSTRGLRRKDSLDSPLFCIRSTSTNVFANREGDSPKTRRISTPELINRRQLLRRKSNESHEHIKASRSSILTRKASNQDLINNNEVNDLKTAKYHSPAPTRQRKLSNLLRKISLSSKTLNRRSLHLPLEKTTSGGGSSHDLGEREKIINERDHALEEWNESAKKCEELIDELDCTLTELIYVKSDRDSKQSELDHLLEIYQTDLEDRDMEIEDLHTKIIELNEVQAVLRAERDEAFDQRDEQFKNSYELSLQIKEMKSEIEETEQESKDVKNKYQCLKNEVEYLRQESLIYENNNNHNNKSNLPMLILDSPILTDDVFSSRKNADHSPDHEEDMDSVKIERDRLRMELERIRRLLTASAKTKHMSLSTSNTEDDNWWLDESLRSSLREVRPSIPVSEDDVLNGDIHGSDETVKAPCTQGETSNELEYYEDIAICIDTFDSRTGLKLDNAFDEPRVIVSDVTKQLEQKWNIKKHDRIMSVNGVAVHRADKKVVERLIKDTLSRTISLVLRREKVQSNQANVANVEVTLGKQYSLGLSFALQISSIDHNDDSLAPGLENLRAGDVITKINSQDVNSMLSMLIKKLGKKSSNNKITFRMKRGSGLGTFTDLPKKPPRSLSPSKSYNSIANSIVRPRKMSSESTRNILSDISSLFSFTSRCDDNNTLPRRQNGRFAAGRASFHGFSNIPPHQPPPPRLTKQRGLLSVPSMSVEETSSNDDEEKLPYSPQRSTSFESFTQTFMSDSAATDTMRSRVQTPDLIVEPPRRPPLYRPSPRLRRIEDDSSGSERVTRQHKSKSLYLEVLNRRSFAASVTIPDVDDQQQQQIKASSSSRDNSTIPQTLRNVSGYATLPRRYKSKSSKRNSRMTKSVRILKNENEPIGFKINGGNKIGIFVTEITPGTPAHNSNLRVGDKLLHLNSLDLTRATLDFATRVLINNQKTLKIRIQVEENGQDHLDLLQNPYLESLYVRTLRSYNATNLNEMSFKAGDILHITDTRHNFDEANMVWTWYGARKISSTKQLEGEIPAIEGFIQTNDAVDACEHDGDTNTSNRRHLRRLSKSAQDLKRWLSRKPSIKRRKNNSSSKVVERTFSNGGI